MMEEDSLLKTRIKKKAGNGCCPLETSTNFHSLCVTSDLTYPEERFWGKDHEQGPKFQIRTRVEDRSGQEDMESTEEKVGGIGYSISSSTPQGDIDDL